MATIAPKKGKRTKRKIPVRHPTLVVCQEGVETTAAYELVKQRALHTATWDKSKKEVHDSVVTDLGKTKTLDEAKAQIETTESHIFVIDNLSHHIINRTQDETDEAYLGRVLGQIPLLDFVLVQKSEALQPAQAGTDIDTDMALGEKYRDAITISKPTAPTSTHVRDPVENVAFWQSRTENKNNSAPRVDTDGNMGVYTTLLGDRVLKDPFVGALYQAAYKANNTTGEEKNDKYTWIVRPDVYMLDGVRRANSKEYNTFDVSEEDSVQRTTAHGIQFVASDVGAFVYWRGNNDDASFVPYGKAQNGQWPCSGRMPSISNPQTRVSIADNKLNEVGLGRRRTVVIYDSSRYFVAYRRNTVVEKSNVLPQVRLHLEPVGLPSHVDPNDRKECYPYSSTCHKFKSGKGKATPKQYDEECKLTPRETDIVGGMVFAPGRMSVHYKVSRLLPDGTRGGDIRPDYKVVKGKKFDFVPKIALLPDDEKNAITSDDWKSVLGPLNVAVATLSGKCVVPPQITNLALRFSGDNSRLLLGWRRGYVDGTRAGRDLSDAPAAGKKRKKPAAEKKKKKTGGGKKAAAATVATGGGGAAASKKKKTTRKRKKVPPPPSEFSYTTRLTHRTFYDMSQTAGVYTVTLPPTPIIADIKTITKAAKSKTPEEEKKAVAATVAQTTKDSMRSTPPTRTEERDAAEAATVAERDSTLAAAAATVVANPNGATGVPPLPYEQGEEENKSQPPPPLPPARDNNKGDAQDERLKLYSRDLAKCQRELRESRRNRDAVRNQLREIYRLL